MTATNEHVRAANAILRDTSMSRAKREAAFFRFVYENREEILDGVLDEDGQVIR